MKKQSSNEVCGCNNCKNSGFKVIATHIIKSKTNYGEPAKQTFKVSVKDGNDPALIIYKRVFTDRINSYLSEGYKVLKRRNGMALVEQAFSIKLKTLTEVINWIKTL